MNKANLVEEVALITQGPRKKTFREAIDAVFSAITDSRERADKVTLVGFRTFQVAGRKERQKQQELA